MRYYEDLVIGTLTKSELTYEVTREEVIDFAGKYDPQPFHLDDDDPPLAPPMYDKNSHDR